jgi:hypothetical protein
VLLLFLVFLLLPALLLFVLLAAAALLVTAGPLLAAALLYVHTAAAAAAAAAGAGVQWQAACNVSLDVRESPISAKQQGDTGRQCPTFKIKYAAGKARQNHIPKAYWLLTLPPKLTKVKGT